MKKGPSRLVRTLRSLGAMIALGAGLAAYSAVTQRRDVETATGTIGPAQRSFFETAADRPDITLFFKGLSPRQKVLMAERIGQYDDPKLATLIGKLLGTFDAEARTMLTRSLVRIGRGHPEVVAGQLGVAGSLQQLAVSSALGEIGPPALPSVAAQLKDEGARANAVAYLVSVGPKAVPTLMPLLSSSDQNVRLAAADALGKLGAKEAVPPLLDLYRKAEGDERFGYLSALAGIGDPRTEDAMSTEVKLETRSTPQRAQAMLGLGRIGTASAIQTLWRFTEDVDDALRDAAVAGLQIAGPAALKGSHDPRLMLRVAENVHGPEADATLREALGNPALSTTAARASGRRPTLVPDLVRTAKGTSDGELMDAACRSLATTDVGRKELARLADDPEIGGIAQRRLTAG